MQADGRGWLFAPHGLLDGPLPTHYEPAESPVRNSLYTQQANPARLVYPRADNELDPSPPEPGSTVFPYVVTTSRLTEHHTAGGMSRFLPYLTEIQPELFMEISPQLAAERGLRHLDWAHLVNVRSAVEARVLITDRLRPMTIDGRVVHQIWIPYHWGSGEAALTTGDSANDLFGLVLDPNVHIQEVKAATCDLVPGRRPQGRALLAYIDGYRRRAGVVPTTGTVARTSDLERP
jgi:formate dehydrogenase major subunit